MSGLGDGLTDALVASRDVVSNFNGAGLGVREDDGFRVIAGEEAEREGLPGRAVTIAPGVALMLRTPIVLLIVALSVDDILIFPFEIGSIACACSRTASSPPGKLRPNPLCSGGTSSSWGAGRIGIEPGDEVRSSIWLGESFSSFGVSPLMVRGDGGALLLRLAVSCPLTSRWPLIRPLETLSSASSL